MLIVAICSRHAEQMLADGVGPALAPDACCPGCEGPLGPWPGYTRLVRHNGHTTRLRVRRCRCRRCGRTHALLPSFLLAYRRDLVAGIAAALIGAARATGHRKLARQAAVPAATVRGWLRRARCNQPARATLVRMLVELGGEPPRPTARGDPLNWLLDAIAAVHQAARARFAAIDDCPFNVASAITNGTLLSRCA